MLLKMLYPYPYPTVQRWCRTWVKFNLFYDLFFLVEHFLWHIAEPYMLCISSIATLSNNTRCTRARPFDELNLSKSTTRYVVRVNRCTIALLRKIRFQNIFNFSYELCVLPVEIKIHSKKHIHCSLIDSHWQVAIPLALLPLTSGRIGLCPMFGGNRVACGNNLVGYVWLNCTSSVTVAPNHRGINGVVWFLDSHFEAIDVMTGDDPQRFCCCYYAAYMFENVKWISIFDRIDKYVFIYRYSV